MSKRRMDSVGTILRGFLTATLLSLVVLGQSACATHHAASATPIQVQAPEINDPIEPVNRAVFKFNDILDMAIIEPAAKVYKAVLPDFLRIGLANFVHNLDSPIIVANQLLQGDIGGAGVSTARFAINTTAGVAGLVDVASAQGLTYRPADFGQTLGVWGVGNGCYLVLPLLGPSSLRDGVGLAVDSYASPVRIIADNTDNEWFYYTTVGIKGIDTRTHLITAIDDLRKNSLDYYAAVRSAYAQKRKAMIAGEQPIAPENLSVIPDYGDHP